MLLGIYYVLFYGVRSIYGVVLKKIKWLDVEKGP